VLLTCSYKGKEFIRIGYYVHVDYNDEALRENPPETPQIASLYRTVLTDHPRVTRFPNDFDNVALPEAAAALDPALNLDEQQQAAAQPMVF
jgi:histone chaperone ASF1